MDVSYQLSHGNFPSESSPLPSPGIELTLFGYVTGSNQRHYPLCPGPVFLRTYVYEFLGIINLSFFSTIFTSAHIAILLLSLHFFLPELILQLYCYYCFSLALLITGFCIVLISMLGRLRIFLWHSVCADSLSLRIFQWCSLSKNGDAKISEDKGNSQPQW